jgi:Cytochrome P460
LPRYIGIAFRRNNKILVGAFPGAQSFVVGSAANVQFMIKDSKRYAAMGGWGFGDLKDGKPGDEALHKTCFACREPAKARASFSLTTHLRPDIKYAA